MRSTFGSTEISITNDGRVEFGGCPWLLGQAAALVTVVAKRVTCGLKLSPRYLAGGKIRLWLFEILDEHLCLAKTMIPRSVFG
jgi:hypothetical protein